MCITSRGTAGPATPAGVSSRVRRPRLGPVSYRKDGGGGPVKLFDDSWAAMRQLRLLVGASRRNAEALPERVERGLFYGDPRRFWL